ncbi:MAG TPA: hypothetical protein DCS93_28955 [Microscillaceae bacterium]|nr:hypothetical protein [Microscillaceae bacterium]
MLLLEEQNLTVELLKEDKALLMTWNGYTSDDHYKRLLDEVYELMKKHEIKKTLHDVSKHKGITPQSQDYAVEQSLAFSRRHWDIEKRAMVFSPDQDVFSKFGIQRFVKKVEDEDYQHQHREFFDNLDEAKYWLLHK